MNVIYDKYGIPRKLTDLNFVEQIFNLKATNASNPWPVIAKILELWAQKDPKAWKSFLVNVEDTKNTRKNGGVSEADPVHGGKLHYTLDIPEFVMYAIRMVYNADELPMNKEFYDAFARNFPKFKVTTKK